LTFQFLRVPRLDYPFAPLCYIYRWLRLIWLHVARFVFFAVVTLHTTTGWMPLPVVAFSPVTGYHFGVGRTRCTRFTVAYTTLPTLSLPDFTGCCVPFRSPRFYVCLVVGHLDWFYVCYAFGYTLFPFYDVFCHFFGPTPLPVHRVQLVGPQTVTVFALPTLIPVAALRGYVCSRLSLVGLLIFTRAPPHYTVTPVFHTFPVRSPLSGRLPTRIPVG